MTHGDDARWTAPVASSPTACRTVVARIGPGYRTMADASSRLLAPHRTRRLQPSPRAIALATARPEEPRADDQALSRSALRARDHRRPGTRHEPALRRHLARRASGTPGPPSQERRAAGPADRGSRRRAGRAVPPGRPHLRRLAVRRHVPQGPSTIGLCVRAGLRRAGHERVANPARLHGPAAPGVVRAGQWRPAARADPVGAARGSVQAHPGDRSQHESGRGALPGPIRASGRHPGRARGRRHPTRCGREPLGTDPRRSSGSSHRRHHGCWRPSSSSGPPPVPSRSPTATTATRPPSTIATSGG